MSFFDRLFVRGSRKLGIPVPELKRLALVSAIFGLLFWWLFVRLQQKDLDLPYLIAYTIAALAYIAFKFVPMLWVFKEREATDLRKQMAQYFLSESGVFVINLAALPLLVDYGHLNRYAAQGVLSVVLTIVNFIVSKRIFTSPILAKVPSSWLGTSGDFLFKYKKAGGLLLRPRIFS